jgi:hypothetical protein
MMKLTTVFSQLQALLPYSFFQQLLAGKGADRKVQKATCWSHFQVLLIGLLTSRSRLRDLSTFLEDRLPQLLHLRIGSVNRSTLSYANRHRPVEVLQSVYQALLQQYQKLAFTLPKPLRNRLLRLDSTVIPVSHILAPWATWAEGRAGVRLHVGLEGNDLIPTLVRITPYKFAERMMAKQATDAPGTILCFDRGYFNPSWFTALQNQECIFVTRWTANTNYKVVRKLVVAKASPVTADEILQFTGRDSGAHCSLELRRITSVVPETGKRLIFLTNQLRWPAQTIADRYPSRWEIETFFRWLKSTLKLRGLWSPCDNGIQWQIWSALILHLMLKLLLLHCKHGWSLLTIMRKLTAMLFEPMKLDVLLRFDKNKPVLNVYLCSTYS